MRKIDPFLSELRKAQLAGQQVLAAAAQRRPQVAPAPRPGAASSHGSRVEQHQHAVQPPAIG